MIRIGLEKFSHFSPGHGTVVGVSGVFSSSGRESSSDYASIEYLLAKRSILKQYHAGQISKSDLCDAHPDLIRAAKSLGVPSGETCEVCNVGDIVHISYAFGPKLPAHGRCIAGSDELTKLKQSVDEFTCYVVEVCTQCRFNHLVRQFK